MTYMGIEHTLRLHFISGVVLSSRLTLSLVLLHVTSRFNVSRYDERWVRCWTSRVLLCPSWT